MPKSGRLVLDNIGEKIMRDLNESEVAHVGGVQAAAS